MADHSARGFRAIIETLSHRGFFYYTLGSLVSQIGSWAFRVASGWLMWELTHSPTWLGILGFSQQVIAVFSPLAGALADRMDRLRLTRITQFLLLLQGIWLAVDTYAGTISPLSLALLSLLQGLLSMVDQPARYSLYPTLIDPKNLTTAVAMDSITFNTARLLGPVIAGYAIVHSGAGLAFIVNAASFGVFCLCLCIVRAPASSDASKRRKESSLMRDVVEGTAYGIKHPGIGPVLMLLSLFTLLAQPLQNMLPGYVSEIYDGGAVELSWLTAAMGAGAMVGAFWMARKGNHHGLTDVLVRSMLTGALAILALTASDIFWVGLFTVAVSGSAQTLSRGASQILIQNSVDGAMRGRVISLFGVVFKAGPAIGALILGVAAEHFGFRWPLIVSALLLILAWIWAGRRKTKLASVLEVEKERLT
jgi:MFS family permease